MKIDDLLEIEADPKILDFRFQHNKLPMWLYIRYYLFETLIRHYYNLENPHIQINPLSMPLSKKIKYLWMAFKKQPFQKKNSEILIIGSSATCVLENDTYANRLYDFILEMSQNTLLFETSFKFNFPRPRIYENQIFYYDLILILSKLLRNLIKSSSDDVKTIKNFISFLKGKYPLNNQIKSDIEKKLLIQSKRIKISTYLHQKLFELIKPRLLIIEDAHYGGYTEVINLAKRNNIIVAELQHGMVNKNHLAYNYHKNLYKGLQPYLPDYFLVYGKYFSDRVRTPAKCVIIGNNYLNNKVPNIPIQKTIDFLIISGGNIPQFYVELCRLLKNEFPNSVVVFRPHPTERPALQERYKEIIEMDIPIDTSNLYERLRDCKMVISGEFTTVMFEALKYTPRVYVIKTNASEIYLGNEEPFLIANNLGHLIYKIRSDEKASLETIEYVWADNSKERLLNFLQNELGLVL